MIRVDEPIRIDLLIKDDVKADKKAALSSAMKPDK
jgi:hypothetical protein